MQLAVCDNMTEVSPFKAQPSFIYESCRTRRRWIDFFFLQGEMDKKKTVKLIKMNNVLIHVIMLTVMCSPCLSHQQSRCRLSLTLTPPIPPPRPVPHPAAAALNLQAVIQPHAAPRCLLTAQ